MSNKAVRFPTSDELAIMTDDEINRRYASLNGYVDRERRRGNEHIELEKDICFLFREIEIRNQRAEAHNTWISEGGHLNNYDNQDAGENYSYDDDSWYENY